MVDTLLYFVRHVGVIICQTQFQIKLVFAVICQTDNYPILPVVICQTNSVVICKTDIYPIVPVIICQTNSVIILVFIYAC